MCSSASTTFTFESDLFPTRTMLKQLLFCLILLIHLWTFSNDTRQDTLYTTISLSLYRKTFGGMVWKIFSLFGNLWFFVDGSPSVSFLTWHLTHVLIFLDILYGSHILSSKSQIKTHSETRDKTLWTLKNFLFTQIGFSYCKSFLRFKKTNFWSKILENILQHYQSRF
jgi:hypothetical protein